MLDIANDIQPLSHFKRHTPDAVRHLKKTGRPMVLTIDGKAQLVVMDAKAYQEYQKEKERMEMLAFLEKSRQDIRAGRVRPMREAMQEIAKKYGLSSSRHGHRKQGN